MKITYATVHLGDEDFETDDARLSILLDMYHCLGGTAIHPDEQNQTEAIVTVCDLVGDMLERLKTYN